MIVPMNTRSGFSPKDIKENGVSLLVPARNEEATVAHVVNTVSSSIYVKEVLVIDNLSTDNTASLAKSSGARVIECSEIGVGNAMRVGISNAMSPWILRFDADIRNPQREWIDYLVTKANSSNGNSAFVKACWPPTEEDPDIVTNTVAIPGLKKMFSISDVKSPLSGIYLFHRSICENEQLVPDYAIDIQILLLAHKKSPETLQVELPSIYHARRDLNHYFRMAEQILNFLVETHQKRDINHV